MLSLHYRRHMGQSQQRPVADDIILHFWVQSQITHINRSWCPDVFSRTEFLTGSCTATSSLPSSFHLFLCLLPSFLCLPSVRLNEYTLRPSLHHNPIRKIYQQKTKPGKGTHSDLRGEHFLTSHCKYISSAIGSTGASSWDSASQCSINQTNLSIHIRSLLMRGAKKDLVVLDRSEQEQTDLNNLFKTEC